MIEFASQVTKSSSEKHSESFNSSNTDTMSATAEEAALKLTEDESIPAEDDAILFKQETEERAEDRESFPICEIIRDCINLSYCLM